MKLFKKSISLLLTMTLLFGIAQPALAVMTDNPTAGSGIVVKDANGNVIEEDWETAFPYGTFVLAQSEVSIAEGEKEQRITVYRLGGTTGRATAYFQIAPAVTQLEDDCLFIDAAKAQYQKFFEKYVSFVKKNGIIIVDNLDFHGMIFDIDHIKNRNTKQLVKKIKRFKDWIFNHNDYDVDYYPIGDGICVIRRKD